MVYRRYYCRDCGYIGFSFGFISEMTCLSCWSHNVKWYKYPKNNIDIITLNKWYKSNEWRTRQ